jgi:superfamily II DNA or RNA helicase
MVQAPTGAGKTVIAAALIDGARRKHNKVLFVAPVLSLIDQTVEAFHNEGLTEVGVLQAAHHMTDWTQPIQVASVQTLMRRHLPEAQFAVIDEAHRWFNYYRDWFADPVWQNKPIIGLSATPWTRGLGKYYDDLIAAATTAELIESDDLCPFRVYAPSHPDLTGVNTLRGDFDERQLAGAMNKGPLVAGIVQTWCALGEDRPTLCFAVDRAHAKHLQSQFEAAGIPTGYVDAFTPTSERKVIERRFHSGAIKIVCNVGCLTTGIDWDVRCIILARPTKSEILFVQMIGRGLRVAKGKQDCVILDHSDSHLRLGFISDIHHEHLDDGRERQSDRRERPVRLPKECPKCSFLKPPKVDECPACGFKPVRQSGMEPEDGALVEITRPTKNGVTAAEKQSWYSQLLQIERARGYKRGWAGHQYRHKFGDWPRGLNDTVLEPTGEVLNYIKSRQIAFAKRRAA